MAEITRHPSWVFADLTRQRPLFPVAPVTTAAQAIALMDQELVSALPVLDGEEFVGVVTRESVQKALCRNDRTMLQASNQQYQLAAEEHQKLRDWSKRLTQLHGASRALSGVLAHTSLETDVLQ